ncbi:MAG TPA: phytanoyl-CoA dioxygenase family protein [Acidimicrobiales bacterium]|nr:phytanoyl-CoA dioxygenase family protein [Acidimicrobiales bacterium]
MSTEIVGATAGEAIGMREVTEDEGAFFRQHGWVKLDGLLPASVAGAMLDAVRDTMLGAEGGPLASLVDLPEDPAERIFDFDQWRDWHFPARDHGVEPLRSVVFSRQIGLNTRRLLGREVGVNYHADLLAVKMPQGHEASGETTWHQDWINFPFDRVGFLTFWIALDEVTPAQGSMRFLSGSHHDGPLGRRNFGDAAHVVAYYPDLLDRYELSPPLHLAPGDATVHTGLVVHSAPPNTTDRPRWSLVTSYHPADTCYTGAPHHIFHESLGLEVGQPIRHPQFPTIYP